MSVVYFVQASPGGPIKIGVSTNLRKRMEQLQNAHATTLAILATAPGSYLEEARVHRRFRALRIAGEWFRPSDELLAFIADTKAAPDAFAAGVVEYEDRHFDELRERAARANDEMYELIGRCVEEFGGIEAFAARMGTTPRDVYQRLHREVVGGHPRLIFIDWLAYLGTKPSVAAMLIEGAFDIFGRNTPGLREAWAKEEQMTRELSALVRAAKACGPLGEAAIARAAADLGADVAEFEP